MQWHGDIFPALCVYIYIITRDSNFIPFFAQLNTPASCMTLMVIG